MLELIKEIIWILTIIGGIGFVSTIIYSIYYYIKNIIINIYNKVKILVFK